MAVGRPRVPSDEAALFEAFASSGGKPAECPWDSKLAVAMAECGLALEEEAVATC